MGRNWPVYFGVGIVQAQSGCLHFLASRQWQNQDFSPVCPSSLQCLTVCDHLWAVQSYIQKQSQRDHNNQNWAGLHFLNAIQQVIMTMALLRNWQTLQASFTKLGWDNEEHYDLITCFCQQPHFILLIKPDNSHVAKLSLFRYLYSLLFLIIIMYESPALL